MPNIIISDRDPKFTPSFWKSFMAIMSNNLSMTTSHRAQSDGQTDRHNLMLEDSLCCIVSYHGDDWSDHLGTIKFAHARLVSKSTQLSPYKIDTGRQVSDAFVRYLKGGRKQIFVAEYARNFADKRQKIIDLARTCLVNA